MSYESIVYRILIASPSDVEEEREVVARVIQDWNDLNSFNKKIVLLPVRWETHTTPTYGIRPQEVINRQIVDDCDLLIGFFWTRIGSPTGEDVSGTIEEIKRVSKAGKPVMLYFSKRGKDPSQIDLTQLQALNRFKEDIYSIALIENFNSIVDFRDKISRQLEMKIRELQERLESNKEVISFSFINQKTGELTNKLQEFGLERVVITEKVYNEILKKDKKLNELNYYLNNQVFSYINKKNNIPIVLGIRNNTNRILGNVIVELKISCSHEDALKINTIGPNAENSVYEKLKDSFLTEENEESIRNIFKANLTQTSSNNWEYSFKSVTLLPNKLKILDIVLVLFPHLTQTIKFFVNVFSDNILQPFSSSSEIKVNVKERQISEDEIKAIIDNVIAVDDLPF